MLLWDLSTFFELSLLSLSLSLVLVFEISFCFRFVVTNCYHEFFLGLSLSLSLSHTHKKTSTIFFVYHRSLSLSHERKSYMYNSYDDDFFFQMIQKVIVSHLSQNSSSFTSKELNTHSLRHTRSIHHRGVRRISERHSGN